MNNTLQLKKIPPCRMSSTSDSAETLRVKSGSFTTVVTLVTNKEESTPSSVPNLMVTWTVQEFATMARIRMNSTSVTWDVRKRKTTFVKFPNLKFFLVNRKNFSREYKISIGL